MNTAVWIEFLYRHRVNKGCKRLYTFFAERSKFATFGNWNSERIAEVAVNEACFFYRCTPRDITCTKVTFT